MVKVTRQQRIAEQIREDIMDILRHEVKDPRLVWVTVSEVDLGREMSWAKIYYTVLGDKDLDGVANALHSASGFIRSLLAKRFTTYSVPQLKFTHDTSLTSGTKMLKILDEVAKEFTPDDLDKLEDDIK